MIVFLLSSQAQRVNVIFDLFIFLKFLTSLDKVYFYSTGEVRTRSDRVGEQTWRIILLLR